jgi:hypothetical protein
VIPFSPAYSTFNNTAEWDNISLIAHSWIGDKQSFVIIAAGASMTIACQTFAQNGLNGCQASAI